MPGDPGLPALPAEIALSLQTPREKRSPAQAKALLDYRLEQDLAGGRLKEERGEAERAGMHAVTN